MRQFWEEERRKEGREGKRRTVGRGKQGRMYTGDGGRAQGTMDESTKGKPLNEGRQRSKEGMHRVTNGR